MIGPLPVVAYIGLIGIIIMFATIFVGLKVMKGKAKMQHHKMLAISLLVVGIVHGILAMGLYF